MVETVEIALGPLSAEAFAPFGQIIGEPAGPAAFAAPHLRTWRLAFEAVGGAELMFCRYAHQDYRFTAPGAPSRRQPGLRAPG